MSNMSKQQEYNAFMKTVRPFGFDGFYKYMDFKDFVAVYRQGVLKGEKQNRWITLEQDTFVRTNYKERTDMLYESEGIKATEETLPHMPVPVALIFDSRIASLNGVHFSDGDSTLKGSFFYTNIEDAISHIDWKTVFSKQPFTQVTDPREERIRSAELLIPNDAPMDYVERIVFRSEADLKNATTILGPDRRYEVNPKKFFCFKGFTIGPNKTKNIFNYIQDYDVTVKPGVEVELVYRFAADDIMNYEHEFKIVYKNGEGMIDDGNYYKSGVLWHWIGELEYNEPFVLTYSINGHEVIHYRHA